MQILEPLRNEFLTLDKSPSSESVLIDLLECFNGFTQACFMSVLGMHSFLMAIHFVFELEMERHSFIDLKERIKD